MKDGLQHAATAQPLTAVAGEQTLPDQSADHLVGKGVFAVVAVVVLQHMLDRGRIADQIDGQQGGRKADNAAVAGVQLRKKGERPLLQVAHIAQSRQWRGAGWI